MGKGKRSGMNRTQPNQGTVQNLTGETAEDYKNLGLADLCSDRHSTSEMKVMDITCEHICTFYISLLEL